MHRTPALIASAAIVTAALAGCSSGGSSLCTTNSCIVTDAQHGLIGQTAQDGAVATKAACDPSTVKDNPGGTFTVTCDVTESDGKVFHGYANLVPSQDRITFEPISTLGQ